MLHVPGGTASFVFRAGAYHTGGHTGGSRGARNNIPQGGTRGDTRGSREREAQSRGHACTGHRTAAGEAPINPQVLDAVYFTSTLLKRKISYKNIFLSVLHLRMRLWAISRCQRRTGGWCLPFCHYVLFRCSIDGTIEQLENSTMVVHQRHPYPAWNAHENASMGMLCTEDNECMMN